MLKATESNWLTPSKGHKIEGKQDKKAKGGDDEVDYDKLLQEKRRLDMAN